MLRFTQKAQRVLPFSQVLASHRKDSKVLLAGDWHGNLAWGLARLDEAVKMKCKLILHLGDFGFWLTPKGERFLEVLNAKASRLNIDIFVTPGNHENWDWLFSLWNENKGQPVALASNVWAMPRGFRFELNSVSFLSFGGAASVDFDNRTLGKNWWPRELPSLDDVDLACAGGKVDVLLTHETPDLPYAVPQAEQIISDNPMGFRIDGLAYSKISRERLTKVMLATQPKLLAHGHMHVFEAHEVQLKNALHETTILSLHRDKFSGNIYELNLENFSTIVKGDKYPGRYHGQSSELSHSASQKGSRA